MVKAKVFMIMPFSDDFFESYELLKSHFEDAFEFSHAGEEDNQQNILADIIQPIYDADVVIADLTGLNANVMYELGIAHSFNKKTIIITRDDMSSLPFDLKQYRTKGYSTHFKQFHELLDYLEKHLKGAIDGSVVFNNPVNDFLDKNKLAPQDLFVKEVIQIDLPDGEKGYIDFLADIDEETEKMVAHILDMNSEMKIMNRGINECMNEVNRAKRTGGNGTNSFARKQIRKVAEYMDTFSKQLNGHNQALGQIWGGLEKDILGLLENSFTVKEDNKEALITFLKSLHGMQNSIKTANASISIMKEASLKNIGLEKSLSQAIRFMDEDLKTYLSITEQMICSIDRIFTKSKFVVGELDFS